MPTSATWLPPRPQVAALIQSTVTRLMESPQELFDDVNAAVLATTVAGVAADATLAAAVTHTNASLLLHWTSANLHHPGAPVPPHLGPETLDIARDLVRRGLTDTSLTGYRVGQSIAWRHWMRAAFATSQDPQVLAEMLDLTARSSERFVDETLAGIQAQIDAEREQLVSGAQADRLEVVSLILDGAPITAAVAGARLRYDLSRPHTAAILWGDPAVPVQGQLERSAGALARACGAPSPFTVAASASSLWAWISTDREGPEDLPEMLSPGVRAALGSRSAPGIEGFRRSHLDAAAVQRLMHRMPHQPAFASYQDVKLMTLIATDEERTADFLQSTLGAFASADPVLRQTVRTYLREDCSTSRTAEALFAHRNTVLNRLAKAQELLPVPLTGHGLSIGLALEVQHWLGTPPLTPSSGSAYVSR